MHNNVFWLDLIPRTCKNWASRTAAACATPHKGLILSKSFTNLPMGSMSEILETKVIQFSCYTKLIEIKNVLLNWYSPTKWFFLERFRWFLTSKINFENQILVLFDVYLWPFNKSHEKINTIFQVWFEGQHQIEVLVVPQN